MIVISSYQKEIYMALDNDIIVLVPKNIVCRHVGVTEGV